MKGFSKIALLFGLLGGLMAYFILPVQHYYKSHCGTVSEEIKKHAKTYARESGE